MVDLVAVLRAESGRFCYKNFNNKLSYKVGSIHGFDGRLGWFGNTSNVLRGRLD